MENRYQYTTETTGSDSPRHYETTLLPNILPKLGDVYIRARYTDRLDLLAFQYYGQASLWWVIAEANKLGKGSLYIEPGIQIRIPSSIGDLDTLIQKTQEGR